MAKISIMNDELMNEEGRNMKSGDRSWKTEARRRKHGDGRQSTFLPIQIPDNS